MMVENVRSPCCRLQSDVRMNVREKHAINSENPSIDSWMARETICRQYKSL